MYIAVHKYAGSAIHIASAAVSREPYLQIPIENGGVVVVATSVELVSSEICYTSVYDIYKLALVKLLPSLVYS